MVSDPCYRLRPEGLELVVKATPKAKQNRVIGFTPQGLKIQITAAPEKGNANDAIIALLAKHCHVAKNAVQLLAGETSQHKKILVLGDARALLAFFTTTDNA